LPNHEVRSRLPTILGLLGVSCGVLGVIAWIEYGRFATRAISAVTSRDSELAHRLALYADGFRFAEALLGVLSVGLGWTAKARSDGSGLVRRLGVSAVCLGVAVLALLFLLV
jgi:hypothetical protein